MLYVCFSNRFSLRFNVHRMESVNAPYFYQTMETKVTGEICIYIIFASLELTKFLVLYGELHTILRSCSATVIMQNKNKLKQKYNTNKEKHISCDLILFYFNFIPFFLFNPFVHALTWREHFFLSFNEHRSVLSQIKWNSEKRETLLKFEFTFLSQLFLHFIEKQHRTMSYNILSNQPTRIIYKSKNTFDIVQ